VPPPFRVYLASLARQAQTLKGKSSRLTQNSEQTLKSITMRIYTSLFFLLALNISPVHAQKNIKVEEEYNIARMMSRFAEINKTQTTTSGWRIQLVATTDRRKMEETRESFLRNYPGISIDWEHAKPYYRLRAGAFKTKLEAIRVLEQLKKDYPSAFPAQVDNIEVQDLIEL
jgi:SPOR domain